MTLVITDGQYVIADKRRYSKNPEHPEKYSENRDFHRRSHHGRKYFDGIDKLIPAPMNVKYGGVKVLAISAAGQVKDIDAFYRLMHLCDLKAYFASIAGTTVGPIGPTYSVLAIMEDQSSVSIDVTIPTTRLNVKTVVKPKGAINYIGCGGDLISHLTSSYNAKFENVSLLDMFLFGANSTSGCSTNYDVYGVQENQYYRDRCPNHDALKVATRRVLSTVNFCPKKQHYL